MRAMRSRMQAACFAVLLGLTVTLMHGGLMPVGHAMPAVVSHQGGDPRLDAAPHHGPEIGKQSFDAVGGHEAHDCAGTVVEKQPIGSPALVAILPIIKGAVAAEPRDRAALARGPPPWIVLSLAELCLLRI